MAEHESGWRWWLRYIVMPLVGSGGVIAIVVALVSRPMVRVRTETKPNPPAVSGDLPSKLTPPGSHTSPPLAASSPQSPLKPAPRHQSTPRHFAPSVSQTGQNNIAQIGNNNQATINPEPPEGSWVITEESCRELLGSIRANGNSINVSIAAFISDPDGANIAIQLARCLPRVPGWKVVTAVVPPVPEGVTVTTSIETEPIAGSLKNGLQAIGFSVEVKVIPNSTDIEVWIGKNALKRQP